jgi:uncharacterized linocin/CFP29 family protein
MSHLLREHAPITETGWALLDAEARERLEPALAARKLIDFAGPHGWQHSATNLGRTQKVAKAPAQGVTAAQRQVLPLVELRAPFSISRAELEAADRGAEDTDLGPLDEAAHQIAVAENAAVFHGWKAAAISGILESSSQQSIKLGNDCERYPRHVAKAVEALLAAGVGGPYGLALGPDPRRPARLVTGPERGGSAQPARRRLPLRVRRRPRDRLRRPRRRVGPALPAGELQLPRRQPRGRGSAYLARASRYLLGDD